MSVSTVATARGWPIRADHCFMRVCLDVAFGQPWHLAIARPAIRHIGIDDLQRAVAVAVALRDGTADLRSLNRRSISDRAAHAERTGSG